MQQLSLKKNMMWNSLGTTVYLFCQWLTSVLVVRLVGFTTAGYLSLAMSLSSPFLCIALYGIRNFQVSDLAHTYNDRSYLAARMLTSAVSLAVCGGFLLLQPYNAQQRICVFLYMVYRISEAYVDVYHGICQRAMRMDVIGKSMLVRGVASLMAFVAVLAATGRLEWAILAMAAVCYAVILLYDIPFTHRLGIQPDAGSARQVWGMLGRCLPLVVNAFLSTVIISIPRYYLELYHGSQVLGIYASVATPAVIIQTLAGFLFNPLITVFARHYEAGDRPAFMKLLGKTALAIGALAAAGLLGCALLGSAALGLLFGAEILPYAYLLYAVVLSSCLTAFIWFIGAVLTVIRKQNTLIGANLLGVGICLGLSLALVGRYGMDGVNISILVALAAQALCMVGYAFYYIPRRFAAKNSGAGSVQQ
ncbi:MAG: lipopolysaccharide biosynthesis protein [Eubacteriales bacterium]|nr:lipopolysaccharide biosynthesis protein [Eubacteriales bacterium]